MKAPLNLDKISCIVFDFGFTLSSDLYFKVAPPEYPSWHAQLQPLLFGDSKLFHAWMLGDIDVNGIARYLTGYFDLSQVQIIEALEAGCRNLTFNEPVLEFVKSQRALGKKTALVTANIDLFTTVVVPSHGLEKRFDVILNTFDYQTLDKTVLWERAFDQLNASYKTSLLIEDGSKVPALFRAKGGYAYQYEGDEGFLEWLSGLCDYIRHNDIKDKCPEPRE